MLSQVVYATNADWNLSYEAMVKNPLVIADRTEKGLLWFKFKENRTVFLLSPLGKLQAKWNDVSEKRTLFRLVRNLLVAVTNEKLLIKPVKQQTWIEYPVPESFKLYWCDSASEFVLSKTSDSEEAAESGKKVSTGECASAGGPKVVGKSSRPVEGRSMVCFVLETLEELRRELRFLREPTLNEVALKSGCLKIDDLKTGLIFGHWKEQSHEVAKVLAERSLNLAAWIRLREKGELNPRLIFLAKEAIDRASLEALGRSQIILKNSPELVPQINGTELSWSEEAKREWIRIFGCEPPSQMT